MADPDGALGPAVTHDCFFGERLAITQPASGHRAGTDAVLLAAAVPRGFAGLAYDAGAGVGTAGLGIALACPAARVGLIENDPLAARLAETNITRNGYGDRVRMHACDLLSPDSRRDGGVGADADLVLTNPPFFAPGTVRGSPDARRRAAHIAGEGGVEGWLLACLALLRPHGMLIAIHVTEALPRLLAVLERRAGAVTILPIHTKPGAPAKRILLRALTGSRAPFAIGPGLVLNDERGPTREAQRINRGEIGVGWP